MNDFTPTQSILNNYIQNKLSDTETEQLELWLADHPETMDDLEMGEMFKQSLNLNLGKQDNTSNSLKMWWKNLFVKPVLIFSHVLLFVSGMLVLNLISTVDTQKTISNPLVVMLSHVRGKNEGLEWTNNKDLIIQIPVEYLSQDLYQVTIKGDSGIKFELNKIKPESDIISLLIPELTLTKGKYDIVLTNETNHDQFNYQIKVLSNYNN